MNNSFMNKIVKTIGVLFLICVIYTLCQFSFYLESFTRDHLQFSFVHSFIFLGLLVGSGVTILCCLKNIYWSFVSPRWPTTQGTILNSIIANTIRYRAPGLLVSFEYSVEGKKYVGKKLSFNPIVIDWRAEKNVLNYPINKSITVYYNPKRPDVAVITPGILSLTHIGAYLFTIIFGLITFFGSLCMLGIMSMMVISNIKQNIYESQAKTTLKIISIAAESYRAHYKNYPPDENSLINSNPSYLNKSYCGIKTPVYHYICNFNPTDYAITARSKWTLVDSYTITTGGVLKVNGEPARSHIDPLFEKFNKEISKYPIPSQIKSKDTVRHYKYKYLVKKEHKAFAFSIDGPWGSCSNKESDDDARNCALKVCNKYRNLEQAECKIISVNNVIVDD